MGCYEVDPKVRPVISGDNNCHGVRRIAGSLALLLPMLILAFSIPQSGKDINARSLLKENTKASGLDPDNKSFKILSAFAPVFRFYKNNNINYIPRICQRCTISMIRDYLCCNRFRASRKTVHNTNLLNEWICLSEHHIVINGNSQFQCTNLSSNLIHAMLKAVASDRPRGFNLKAELRS